jgi:hypothetical protein
VAAPGVSAGAAVSAIAVSAIIVSAGASVATAAGGSVAASVGTGASVGSAGSAAGAVGSVAVPAVPEGWPQAANNGTSKMANKKRASLLRMGVRLLQG